MTAAPAPAPTRSRVRRWLPALVVLLVVLLVGAWWVNRQLEPNRLTSLVLDKAGASLGLQLRFEGVPEYALKPEPRLLIPNFSASGPDGKAFLTAKRVEISLPWSTITGDTPSITRIELDTPVLDLPGFRRWLATRPEKPFEVPTLTRGLQATDGTIRDTSFAITGFDLDLPRLAPGVPAAAKASGRLTRDRTVVDFDAALRLASAGLASEFRLDVDGVLQQSPKPLPAKLSLEGRFVSDDAGFRVDATRLALTADSPLPSLVGAAHLATGERMQIDFDGKLASWPSGWPTLPQPLSDDPGDLPLTLHYVGPADFSGPLALKIEKDATVLDASVRIPEVMRWMDARASSPLPPLNGTLRSDRLVFDGVELRGVEIEVSDSPAPTAPAP